MKWVSMFSYLPLDAGAPLGEAENLTQQVTLTSDLSGARLRLLLSNRYSLFPLRMERVTVRAGSRAAEITLDGRQQIALEPGQTAYSDAADVAVSPGDTITVSVEIREKQLIGSVCGFWSAAEHRVRYTRSGIVPPGEVFPALAATNGMFFFGFSALQVYTGDRVQTLAAFGDSITQMSFWNGPLQRKLREAFPGQAALRNCGLSGNRLVHDATRVPGLPGQGRLFGAAGVARFTSDVFGDGPTDAVLVLEGINDLLHPLQYEGADSVTPPEVIIEGYKRLAEIAHRHGARIFGLTLPPCGSPAYPAGWMPKVDAARREVNRWIRNNAAFDGFFDADAALRDPAASERILPGCHIGDGLHPNAAGGEKIARAIDITRLIDDE